MKFIIGLLIGSVLTFVFTIGWVYEKKIISDLVDKKYKICKKEPRLKKRCWKMVEELP